MSGDHDADAIRARRGNEALQRLLPHIDKIEKLFGALGPSEVAAADAKAKEAFELGNRVEDALKRVDEAVRAVGDLPDRMRKIAEDADRAVEQIEAAAQKHEQAAATFDQMIADLKAAAQKPAEQPPPPQEPNTSKA